MDGTEKISLKYLGLNILYLQNCIAFLSVLYSQMNVTSFDFDFLTFDSSLIVT